MIEAYTLKNQRINGKSLTTFEASKRLGLYTYISSPLMQRRLVRPVHQQILERFRVKKFSHIPIQFVRSTEGVGTVLIGMSRKEHLIENLEIQEIPHLKPEEIDSMIKERGY